MKMRRFHRWFGTIAGIFMILIGGTGVALQVDLFATGNPPIGDEPGPSPKVDVPSDEQLAAQLVQAMSVIHRERPGFEFSSIQLQLDGARKTVVGGNGPFAPNISVDAATGRILPPPPPRKEGYHILLQDLHAGYFIGLPGRLLSILLGLSLIVLGFSGLSIYWDLFKRRSKGGKKALFWK